MKRLLHTIAGSVCFLGGRLLAQEPPTNPQPLDAILTAPQLAETSETTAPEAERRSEWETDRDSFTPSTKTAARGTLILESAYSFEDNRRLPETHSFPEFLARYGITDRIELRIGWNYEVGGGSSSTSSGGSGSELFGAGLERESNLNLGVKLGITKQDQWIPDSVLILTALTPTSGEETATQFVGSYAVGWELPNRWRLDSGLRFALDSDHGHRFEEWAPSVVLKVPVGEKWDAHIEYFGIFGVDKESDAVIHYISPGLHYLLTENVEVGFRVGWGLNDQSERFFVNTGVGMRF
jgi:Putative MetA-pathway of phenol degradation